MTTSVVAQPITGSRNRTSPVSGGVPLAPNPRGGWNYVATCWEKDPNPCENVAVDIATGAQNIVETPSGEYPTTNQEMRTVNGRLWFPCNKTALMYYDPATEQFATLGHLVNPLGNQTTLYRLAIGPDGLVYAGTQCATGLPLLFRVDPVTLVVTPLGEVGQLPHVVNLSYCYYIAPDSPWVYVIVGQNPWQLMALNMTTGEQRLLATRAGSGGMSFTKRSRGVTVTLTGPSAAYWCLDGDLLVFTSANQNLSPYSPRDTRPLVGTISGEPELDETFVNPGADRLGHVLWRASPGGAWIDTTFEVQYVTPINLESLTALPNGDIMGSAENYHGWFRYSPVTQEVTTYGNHHPSQPKTCVVDGQLYFAGYPKAQLYRYDPDLPWTSSPAYTGPDLNPAYLGFYDDSFVHYATALMASPTNGRIYMVGRNERNGVGTGVGWYDPEAETWGGHTTNLSEVTAVSVVELSTLGCVVLASRPRVANGAPAQLITFDYDLVEQSRQTVLAGLASCGTIYTIDGSTIIGITDTPASKGPTNTSSIYRWSLETSTLIDWTVLSARAESMARKSTNVLVVMLGTSLVEINLTTLAITTLAALDVDTKKSSSLVWQDGSAYWNQGSDVRKQFVTAPVGVDDGVRTGYASIAGGATCGGEGASVDDAVDAHATINGSSSMDGEGVVRSIPGRHAVHVSQTRAGAARPNARVLVHPNSPRVRRR